MWKVSARCLQGVWRMSVWCLEGVWKVSERSLEDVWKVIASFQDGVKLKTYTWNSSVALLSPTCPQILSGNVKYC